MKRSIYFDARKVARWAFLVLAFTGLAACDGNDPQPVTSPGNISTMAGVAGSFDYSGDGGPANLARLGYITGIGVDTSGNIFFVDGAANVVRKINRSTGIISTVAGAFVGFNTTDPTPAQGDGGPAISAHLNVPLAVAVDALSNLYIADAGNNIIRKVDGVSGAITTIAGGATTAPGYGGDGGLATEAAIFTPYDVAVDPSGNVYFADTQNHVIRKISAATGLISTIAGSGPDHAGYAGDGGQATEAKLNTPHGVALDAPGNLYIVDAANHVVRKVNHEDGTISTLVGTGVLGYTGDGGPGNAAKLYAPSRVAVDESGNVYIADQGNHVIRKVMAETGVVTTLAGTGVAGYAGDGGPADEARLSSPQAVAVDLSGNVFIADVGNSVIRAVRQ